MAASRLLGAAAASVTEGSLEVKLPTIKWTDGKKQRWEESEKRREEGKKIRVEKESEERLCRCAQTKVEKLRSYVFPMFCGSGGSKSRDGRLAKVAGAEPSGEMRDGKLHAAVSRTDFEVKKLKAFHARSTLES